MKIEIKSRMTGGVIFSIETDNWKLAVEAAIKAGANLSGANLYGANLSGANLSGADLYGADLSGADLSKADLSGANLSQANLSDADLSGANLSEANLSGADLSGADLYGYFCFGPGGSRNSYTWARWEKDGYIVHCGCQSLKLEDFKKAVKEKDGKTYYAQWYLANIETMKLVAQESKKAWENFKKSKAIERGK